MKNIFTILIFLLLSFSVFGQTTLNNESIIEMVKAGISETVIIAKIKASETSFDTSTQALKALKDNNVSDLVQTAMIEKSSQKTNPEKPSSEGVEYFQPKEIPSVQTPTQNSTPVDSPSFKRFSELSKQERKERLKQPARVAIAAHKEKVAAVIVSVLQGGGFFLKDESASRLVMQKKLSGMNAVLGQLVVGTRGGSTPMATYTFMLNELDSITTVTVDISITSENLFGKSNRADLNKNKKNREEMDNVLLMIKNESEKR